VRSGRRVGGLKQRIEIVSASEIALRKFQFERAVVAKARSDMAPFGEQWLIRCATSDVAANRHRAKRAAVVTLRAGDDAKAFRTPAPEPILASELDRSLG